MGQRDLNTLTYWQTHADNTLNTPTFCHSHAHTLPSQNTRHLPLLLAVNGRAGWERSPGLPPLLPKALQPSLGVLTLSSSFQLPLGTPYSPYISVLMRSAYESILFDSLNYAKHAGKCQCPPHQHLLSSVLKHVLEIPLNRLFTIYKHLRLRKKPSVGTHPALTAHKK